MEKTRVKKDEKYWYIATDYQGNISVYETEDVNAISDRNHWLLQNYFSTKKDAEAMAEKIRKVLKGAWVLTPPEGEIFSRKVEAVLNGGYVIEMPSERSEEYDDIKAYAAEYVDKIIDMSKAVKKILKY